MGHGLVIHQQVAGEVQNDDAVLHGGDGFGIDHLPGVVQQGRVQGDDVAAGKDILPLVHAGNLAVQMPGGVDGDKGVAAVDLHAQPPGGVGQRAAHRAQTDHAQLPPQHLMSGELGFALFNLFGHVAAACNGAHPVDAADHIPAAQQQAAQGQLHHAAGVGTGGVEHHNALLGALVQGDIVHARPGSGHGQKLFRQGHIMHGGAAHQHRVSIRNLIVELVVLLPQGRALGGDFI